MEFGLENVLIYFCKPMRIPSDSYISQSLSDLIHLECLNSMEIENLSPCPTGYYFYNRKID